MNRYLIAALAPLVFCFAGCATPAHSNPKLIQINDQQWVDVSDVKEMLFIRNDPALVANGYAPFEIDLWHRGATDNPFKFTFTDEKTAYESWKHLTAKLGGQLQDDQWKPAVAKVTTPNAPIASAEEDVLYTPFQQDVDELKKCRDDGLLTADEYQRGYQKSVIDLQSNIARGQDITSGRSVYESSFGRLHEHLATLESLAKSHQISDTDRATARAAILTRYGLAAPAQPN